MGQETLKNAATTGPRASASRKENCFPSIVFSVKSGAVVPGVKAAIVRPPKMLCNHFMGLSRPFLLDDLRGAQDFPRQPGQRQERDAALRYPLPLGSIRRRTLHHPHHIVG